MDEQGTKQPTEGAPQTDQTTGEKPPMTTDELAARWYKADKPKEQTGEQQPKDSNPATLPERYELKLPENVTVDEPLMNDFTKLARDHGFTNEQTQRFADLHLRATGELTREVTEFRQMGEKRYEEVENWKNEFQNDLYYGGHKAEQTLSQARKVLDALGTPEEVQRIKTELNRTGLGNHPVLIKGLRAWRGSSTARSERLRT